MLEIVLMSSKVSFKRDWIWRVNWWMRFVLARSECRFALRKRKGVLFPLLMIAGLGLQSEAHGAITMAEPFNYSIGSSLGLDSPWSGSAGTGLGLVTGNLSYGNLQSIVPAGNKLQVTAGTFASAFRTFSATPISSGAVYCSFLINCSVLPTNSQFTVCLLVSGVTTANPPDDPLDLYVRPVLGGYSLSIRNAGSDPAFSSKILASNTTHLIVLKYAFGFGQASLFVDPIPGSAEPVPDATTSSDDDGGGIVAPNLQGIVIRSGSSQGVWNIDSLRVGNSWADVTPFAAPLFLSGPADQAVCSGSPAIFSVVANGTPSYSYSWRTNGVPIPDATNSQYQLLAPGAVDTLNGYDVVVRDSFGAVTSQIAHLTISAKSASIVIPPANQIVLPSSTQALFSVVAAGDAPLSYQWRTNGIAIPGATNNSYSLPNPAPADASVFYDVLVSNPCGATNSPSVSLVFPNTFYAAYDAGPGFFSGENLVLTNNGGMTLQTWSSSSLNVPLTIWNLEGAMQEQPLNDGTGRSLYSINVTPATSTTYYVFGSSISPPYLMPIPVLTITTDSSGFYFLSNSNMVNAPNETLTSPGTSIAIRLNLGGGIELISLGVPGNAYVLQSCATLLPPPQWTNIDTNIADASGLIWFVETNLLSPSGFFRLIAP